MTTIEKLNAIMKRAGYDGLAKVDVRRQCPSIHDDEILISLRDGNGFTPCYWLYRGDLGEAERMDQEERAEMFVRMAAADGRLFVASARSVFDREDGCWRRPFVEFAI